MYTFQSTNTSRNCFHEKFVCVAGPASAFRRRVHRSCSSAVRNEAVSGESGKRRKVTRLNKTVGKPSRIKIHCQPGKVKRQWR